MARAEEHDFHFYPAAASEDEKASWSREMLSRRFGLRPEALARSFRSEKWRGADPWEEERRARKIIRFSDSMQEERVTVYETDPMQKMFARWEIHWFRGPNRTQLDAAYMLIIVG